MGRVLIGTSGYTYKDWKGRFYPQELPQKKWLSYYAKEFPTVEINGSFYTSIKRETYKKWYELTPPDFTFAVKGHRFITQMKKLHGVDNAVEQFIGSVPGLKEKLACILWQFPRSFGRNEGSMERLERFLEKVERGLGDRGKKGNKGNMGRQVFEFREEGWFCEEVYALMRKYNAGLVISDSAKFPFHDMVTADFVYIRFHGPGALYASDYPLEDLKKWAEKIRGYQKKYEVYCYFNNDINGHAVKNARELGKLLNG